VPIVLTFGNLNLLEPSGPVKACNGIDLPFLLPIEDFVRIEYFFRTEDFVRIQDFVRN
jgi:hypothetical protein